MSMDWHFYLIWLAVVSGTTFIIMGLIKFNPRLTNDGYQKMFYMDWL
jgi:hypothetical protein